MSDSLSTVRTLRAGADKSRLADRWSAYPVGMVLLARVAVDQSQQGKGVGAMLLADALRKSVAAGEVAAARLIVVDAVDEEAPDFYQRFGFVQAAENPLRFCRPLKDVRASLDSSDDE
jgi:predicted N-acetyltransferase YhbS